MDVTAIYLSIYIYIQTPIIDRKVGTSTRNGNLWEYFTLKPLEQTTARISTQPLNNENDKNKNSDAIAIYIYIYSLYNKRVGHVNVYNVEQPPVIVLDGVV